MLENQNTEVKEENTFKTDKYLYMSKDRPPVTHQGETVEEFLKRGGTIKTVKPKKVFKK